jgi:hypothetical protein
MSTFTKLEEKHGIQNYSNNDSKGVTYNMPVKIQSYEDDQFFIGERLDTKEIVKIKLRDVPQKGKNARLEVTDFQDKRNKRHAPAGDSILLFDNTYQEEDGTWNSRWANTLHKKRMPSKVIILPSTIRFVDDGTNRYVQVRTIKNRHWINTMEDLEYAITKALQPKGPGTRPFAHIRLTSSDGEKRIYTASPVIKDVTVDEQVIKMPASGEESYQDFLTKERNKMIIECVTLPDITVEVLAGTALYFGGDTRDRLLSTPYLRNMIEPAYLIDPNAEKQISNYGYKPTVIAVRELEDVNGLLFVSDAKPLVNNTPAISIMDLEF